jgi:Rrf2 family nitric oxide-sensitive transcriptional repressor
MHPEYSFVKLTVFTDYSLRVLMHLAAGPQRRTTVAELAQAFGISANHLVKVVHFLGRHGWIATVRGRGGGILLARPAGEIRIGQVVRDTEGTAMPAECFAPQGGSCVLDSVCRLKGLLGEAVGAFYDVLDRHTLADLAAEPENLAVVRLRSRRARAMDTPAPYPPGEKA